MHDPPPNLDCLRALSPEFMEHLWKCLLAKDLFGNTRETIRYQAVNPHTADEPHRIVRKDMIGIEVNWVSVEEAPLFSYEMSSSAVVEKDGTAERPDLLEPVG
jgi:hypothetical protein